MTDLYSTAIEVLNAAQQKYGLSDFGWICAKNVPDQIVLAGATPGEDLTLREFCALPIAVNGHVPPGELHLVRDGVIVAKLVGIASETERIQ